ncbi:amidase family protein [Roseiarcaceae bacterium H3SJ34-1]|uniref:amidase n=1 Tax=Terripilifer ovatus TaxID=3032367 RepID=UPI003AB9A02C|nr:amidase family protein [Roseiarcaceae bacterium H3SJ34-1]
MTQQSAISQRSAFASEAAEVPSVIEIASRYRDGVSSPEEMLDFFLARIAAADAELNSFVCLDGAGSRRQARQSAERWRQGRPLSPIDGVPVTVKDAFEVAGVPFRSGSLVTDATPRTRSAPAVQRLLGAGAVIVGLTTTSEFGGAPVTISPLTGITRNAWNPERTAGGSSGGAAVSVAAGFAAAALASDTGGSIRIPAAFNGMVGLKPTGGRIPTDPASVLRTMGCPGSIARNVADCAHLFAVLGNGRYGAADPTCPDYQAPAASRDLRHMRILASRTLGYAQFLDDEVRDAFDRTIALLKQNGVQVQEITPALPDPIDLFLAYTRANYASILADLDDADVGRLGANVRAARAAGQELSAVDLLAAARGRLRLAETLASEIGAFDILLTPMTAVPPFAADAFAPDHPAVKSNPRAWSPFGSMFNLTENPALTLPCGVSNDGKNGQLPIGLQLVAPKWQEGLLLNAAAQIEGLLNFDASPPLKRVTVKQTGQGGNDVG